jgi:LysM repeat protein
VRPATRLTRRGRLVVVLFVLAVLALGLSVGVSSQAAGPSRPHAVPTVTVQPGETLWQVAVRAVPGADPRLVVDELQRINHLPTATVQAGQQLTIPR